jgi:hypothetical protein
MLDRAKKFSIKRDGACVTRVTPATRVTPEKARTKAIILSQLGLPRKLTGKHLHLEKKRLSGFLSFGICPGANPTTSEFSYNYLHRQRCSRLERFFKVKGNVFVYKTH